MDLKELEKKSFPDHEVNLNELRELAYSKKVGEDGDQRIAKHLTSCAFCKEQMALLAISDPVLNGEDDGKDLVTVTIVPPTK